MTDNLNNAEDAFQDILSSLGPFRLESIVRRGLYTLSCKAQDLSTGRSFLFKLRPRDANLPNNSQTFAKVSSGQVYKREWISRCLIDRLSQFPYVSQAEGRLILSYLCEPGYQRVKASNVMLTQWNLVVIVDSECDDKSTRLLDDTNAPWDLGEFKNALGVDAPLDDFSFRFIKQLALFNCNVEEECFERASYITLQQIDEVLSDIASFNVYLMELIMNALLQVCRGSSVQSTKHLSLCLIHKILLSTGNGLKEFVQLHMVPCLMDCVQAIHQTQSILALSSLAYIHCKICEVSKVQRLHKAVFHNPQLLAVFGKLIKEQSVFLHFIDTREFDLAEHVAEGLSVKQLCDKCISKLLNCIKLKEEKKALQLACRLACKVLDAFQIEQEMLPLLAKCTDIGTWTIILKSGKISKCTIRDMIIESAVYLLPICRSLWSHDDYALYLGDIELSVDCIPLEANQEEIQWEPKIEGEIVEVDDLKASCKPSTLVNGENLFASNELSAARFWEPSKQQCTLPYPDIIKLLQCKDFVLHVTKSEVFFFRTEGYPHNEVKKRLDLEGTIINCCIHACGVFALAHSNCDQKMTMIVYNKEGVPLIKVPMESAPIYMHLFVMNSCSYILLISEESAAAVDLHTKQFKFTVRLCSPASSASVSLHGSFAVIGTISGHIHLLDVRSGCISAIHKVSSFPVLSCMIHHDYSEMTEHRKGRVWVAAGSSLLLIDLANGQHLKEKSFICDSADTGTAGEILVHPNPFKVVMGCVGGNFVAGVSAENLLYWEWRVRRSTVIPFPYHHITDCTFLPWNKCAAIVGPDRVHYIF